MYQKPLNKVAIKESFIDKDIIMLKEWGHFKKDDVSTVLGVSNSGKSLRLEKGLNILISLKGSLFDILPSTKASSNISKPTDRNKTSNSNIMLKNTADKKIGMKEDKTTDFTNNNLVKNISDSEMNTSRVNINKSKEMKMTTRSQSQPDNKTTSLQDFIKITNLGSMEPIVITTVLMAESKVIEIMETSALCAFDCEGINLSATGELTLIQVAYPILGKVRCVIFDVKSLCRNSKEDINVLKPLLEGNVQKVCHDVHMDAAALKHQFDITLSNVIDTQLVFEYLTGKMLGGMAEFLRWCEVPDHPNKNDVRKVFDANPNAWGKRPLSPNLLRYAAHDVLCLWSTVESWMPKLVATVPALDLIMKASKDRCGLEPLEAHKRLVGFGELPLVGEEAMHSWELLHGLDPSLVNQFAKVEVDENVKDLMAYIPDKFHAFLDAEDSGTLRDIILEVGARPYAYYGPQKRVFLSSDPSVVMSLQEMESIVDLFQNSFSSDNRAGIDKSLHRISAMRSNSNKIYSLTYRVGRAVYGNTGMMRDVLALNNKSVLVMGIPGTGKTTIIREVAKQLAEEEFSVIIVDTSNEICGDGLIPHPSVGMARRMMVPCLNKQAAVLIEAVQNHTPDVIICDEIGRVEEVVAMQTVKERGVRCIASAHGCLRGLVNNGQLNGLVGGVENVTVGDVQATKDLHTFGGSFSKVRQQRSGAPVFDVIVELKPKMTDEWTIITDVTTAVDRILAGKTYNAQVRRRDPRTGLMSLELVQC